jgi:hypothetical protein
MLTGKGRAAEVVEKQVEAAVAINLSRMKNRCLTLALVASALSVSGQKGRDSVYKKQRISRTDIQVLSSVYGQNGDHSAITGGTGTEWLLVYSPEFTITCRPDSIRIFQFNMGVDVITSASMDNIDFVRSSASRVFHRLHMDPSCSYLFKKSRVRAGVNSGISIESDYLSIPAGLSVNHNNASGSREISASLQCYFDDLRWGLLGFNRGRPVGLIYPVELRDTNWSSTYRRNSYNLSLAFYQVINEKTQFALFPELVFQKGLLCTPYHRVYFDDGKTERVEKLPDERWKFPLGIQVNFFAGRRLIIRSYYRYFMDNFGIKAHTVQVETPVKISPGLTISPLLRWYVQTAAWYFRSYKAHDPGEQYYTSDYDLSRFTSYKAGLTVRYARQTDLSEHYLFNTLTLRYAFYRRSDGLVGNILSLMMEIEHIGKKDAGAH